MITDSFSAWHLFAIVLCIVTFFIGWSIIKFIKQLTHTMKSIEESVKSIEEIKKELIPIINNFNSITKKTDSIVEDFQVKSSETMEGISEIKQVADILKHSILLFLNTISNYLGFLFKSKVEEKLLKNEVSKNDIIDHIKDEV